MEKSGTKRHPILTFENARILFPNFLGRPTRFNAYGERNFCVEVSHEDAIELRQEGWHILQGSRGDQDILFIRVKIPATASITNLKISGERIKSGSQIDDLDFGTTVHADVEIVLWSEVLGRTTSTAYLIDFDGKIE